MTRETVKRKIEMLDSYLQSVADYGESDHEAMTMAVKALEQEPYDFARWVAEEIFDENWEYNKGAFEELACRRLARMGIVKANGDEWELIEPMESEDKE